MVAAFPVEIEARLLSPGADPASITYDVGAQPLLGACNVNVTAAPLTAATSPPGEPGALGQPPATETMISLDGPLVPLPLRARTRSCAACDAGEGNKDQGLSLLDADAAGTCT